MQKGAKLIFDRINPGSEDVVGTLWLTRPDAANALDDEMVDAIITHLRTVEKKIESCRALVVRGEGKHFCAGADLKGMQKAISLGESENRRRAAQLFLAFDLLNALPVPTIAVVTGAAYGGGVGLVACCDWAVVAENAQFCLPEVRHGLIAAVILPFLKQKMRPGSLRRLVMTGHRFSAPAALAAGLVECVAGDVEGVFREELAALLLGDPLAQRLFKRTHLRSLRGEDEKWKAAGQEGIDTLARSRVSDRAQAGIRAFLAKQPAPWAIESK